MNRLISAVWGLLALFLCLDAWGATYYVRTACANNGDGTTGDCAASGGAAGAYNVMSSITSTADGQVELARGNTVYLIGSSTAAWNPGGVGAGDGASDFVLRGDHSLGAGGFDGQGSVAILSNIGGSSRNNITFRSLYFRNATGNCVVVGNGTNTNTDIEFYDLDIDTCGTSGVQVTGPAATVVVDAIDCAEIGDTVDEAVACVNVTPAAGNSVTGLSVSEATCAGNGKGRYCVNMYPPTNGISATGTVPSPVIDAVRCSGEFYLACVNGTNDVDNAVVRNVNTVGMTAPVGIHVGGQGTIGACPVTTDGWRVSDSVLTGGRRNSVQTGDASGFFPDECSTTWLGERIEAYGNDIAGIYLNDTATGILRGSVSYGNGDNALHIHGVSDGNKFEHNTFTGFDPYGTGSDQGQDVVQQDAGAGTTTPNTFTNNAVVGNSPKCFDIDGSAAYVTESFSAVFGCDALAEGVTLDTPVTDSPDFTGGSTPTTAVGFKLNANSPLRGTGMDLNLGNIPDHGNRAFSHPPSIGAWEAASGDIATARTAASTRTAATTRTAASARTAR